MRAPRSGRLVAGGLLLVTLLIALPARAQQIGYQLNRYEPTPAGDPFAVVEYPWYSSTRWFAGGLTLDYAHNLLEARHLDAMGNVIVDPSPIGNQMAGHLDLAGSLFDRVALTLSVPMVLYESGTAFNGVGPTGAVAGNPRIGARARIWGQPDSKVSVSGAAYLWIPVGEASNLSGDNSVRFMPRITVGGLAIDHIRWAVNASFLYRQTAKLSSMVQASGNTVGSEVQLAAGVSYVGLDHALSVGPEAILSVSVANDLPAGQNIATLELFAAAHYLIAEQIQLGLGVGAAIVGSPGPPDFRLLFSIAYAPRRTPLSRFEQVVVVPDEDGHVGGVEVKSGKQTTVLDKAYASSEISKKDPNLKPVQSSPAALAQKVGPLAQVLPRSDRDGDGIADADDACPDRAGLASPDPIRNGCPKASEKIVVLPDADGHVGGVEVADDKGGKTLIDQPYASAEVGADGRAQAVPPAPVKAIEKSVAAIAQVLPVADRDGDGVPDAVDACPDREGIASPDPVRNGCPLALEKVVVLPDADGHVGGVEVDDGRGKTLIDKPYASAEVGVDGEVHPVPPASPKAIEKSIKAVAAVLPILDTDHDGIRDEDDACPDRAGVASQDPVRNGCPKALEKVVVLPDADGHVGGVEVDDGKGNKTVLDKAYATAEVGTDGKAHAVPSSSQHAIERSLAAVVHALPPSDRDGDGILDQDDGCPDRAGLPDPDPVRNGCPKAVEKIVVLPDENGHVGAVEVDDGHSKTLVDQAYATAEIGVDGRAHKVESKPEEVAQKFAQAMAARPAGARIIIYFNERAEPVRDLTGPITNMVAEVKERPKYSIEVVGHTDQTGSETANRRIGLQRAQLIADRLIAAGVPRDRVRAISKGSSEPAVQVKDRNVAELRNRRVEVFVR